MSLVIQKPTNGKLVLSKIQQYPAVIGEPWGGGYFAGYISHTANGNPTHALIVAPAATGATGTGYTLTTNLQWKTSATSTAGTTSTFDGAANTAAMVAAGIADHPAAQFCVSLNIDGFTDWYLPSRHEYEIAYHNLRPFVTLGSVNDTGPSTVNAYAVPPRNNAYTLTSPVVTHVNIFANASERFSTTGGVSHLSSTETSAATARIIAFNNGLQGGFNNKTILFPVRAFRRIALP